MAVKKILVIEDEAMLRELISDLLEAECYESITAEDGVSGLQKAREHHPDLVVCDVMLPDIDGFTILAKLREEVTTAAVPFIFLTALSDHIDIRRGMNLGADDYLTKPFERDDLLSTIHARLKKQETLEQRLDDHTPQDTVQEQDGRRLLRAIEQSEFLVYYQPQINLQTGALTGAEALIRWHDPDRGLVSPGEFIPLAEKTGAILQMDSWMLDQVCQQAIAWKSEGFPPLKLSVNLSGAQFNQADLSSDIDRVLQKNGLDPKYLSLELTESLLVRNVDAAIAKLSEFQALGIQVAVDDFGTGYASLGYLQHFPFNTLKLDRCFVQHVDRNKKNAAIVIALIQMAHGLGLDVIAEGVETQAERNFLQLHECDTMQGYLVSRPLPTSDFKDFVEAYVAPHPPTR
jgi:EAL domain-containing protein (putative c-di-GMP-specific phosphodiesterase class I)